MLRLTRFTGTLKVIIKRIALIAPTAGLFGLSISYSQPAVAAISCQSGTAVYHDNNSLAGCFLGSNTNVQVSGNNFSCGEGEPIYFTGEGQFSSCTLFQPLTIQRGHEVETCPVNAKVSFSMSQDGNHSITCKRL